QRNRSGGDGPRDGAASSHRSRRSATKSGWQTGASGNRGGRLGRGEPRAALYTASVLNGLHRLGVDRDIVLLSGVSGGGAALAFFAGNHDALTGPHAGQATKDCPDGQWGCFNTSVTKPFIEDVLNGATEWRLFRRTALSQLLVES